MNLSQTQGEKSSEPGRRPTMTKGHSDTIGEKTRGEKKEERGGKERKMFDNAVGE